MIGAAIYIVGKEVKNMEVTGDAVIEGLLEQIKQAAKAIAIKDAQIELLQKEIAKLKSQATTDK